MLSLYSQNVTLKLVFSAEQKYVHDKTDVNTEQLVAIGHGLSPDTGAQTITYPKRHESPIDQRHTRHTQHVTILSESSFKHQQQSLKRTPVYFLFFLVKQRGCSTEGGMLLP